MNSLANTSDSACQAWSAGVSAVDEQICGRNLLESAGFLEALWDLCTHTTRIPTAGLTYSFLSLPQRNTCSSMACTACLWYTLQSFMQHILSSTLQVTAKVLTAASKYLEENKSRVWTGMHEGLYLPLPALLTFLRYMIKAEGPGEIYGHTGFQAVPHGTSTAGLLLPWRILSPQWYDHLNSKPHGGESHLCQWSSGARAREQVFLQ